MINLNDYKNLKKAKLVYKELTEVNQIIIDSIEKLKKYKRYTPVNESLSMLINSKTLIDIHLSKFRKLIDQTKI